MNLNRSKIFFIIILTGFLAACSEPGGNEGSSNLSNFTAAPVLTIIADDGVLGYSWTASSPAADSYDVYWKEGDGLNVTAVRSGTKVGNANSGGTITGLDISKTYSVMVTANKSGYNSINSEIISKIPKVIEMNVTTAQNLISAFENVTPGNYVINLTGNLTDFPGIFFDTPGATVTVKGTGSNKITWKAAEDDGIPLFNVHGGTIIIEDIDLFRAPNNNGDSMIFIYGEGTVKINRVNMIGIDKFEEGVFVLGGTLIVDSGSFSNFDIGIQVGGGASVTLIDVVIEDNLGGICINDPDAIISITGGAIINNFHNGIVFWPESENCELTIDGGEICGNQENGLSVGGVNITINLNNTEIIDNEYSGIDLWGIDGKLTVTGIIISQNSQGIGLAGESENWEIVINEESIISGNGENGIGIDGTGHSIIFTDIKISDNEDIGIKFMAESENCSLDISGDTVIRGNGARGIEIHGAGHYVTITDIEVSGNEGDGIVLFGNGSELVINGGLIMDNDSCGIAYEGPGHISVISDVNISGNKGQGIVLGGDSENCTLEIYGGTISGNEESGFCVEGASHTIIVSDVEIEGNNDNGIIIWANNCVLNINGGVVSDNDNDGVMNFGTGNNIIIKDVNISGNHFGVISHFESKDSTILICGSTIISGCRSQGVFIDGGNNEFTKEEGSIIYGGNTAEDLMNVGGAIKMILIYRDGTAGINDVLTAKINAAGDGIEDCSGDWEWY